MLTNIKSARVMLTFDADSNLDDLTDALQSVIDALEEWNAEEGELHTVGQRIDNETGGRLGLFDVSLNIL